MTRLVDKNNNKYYLYGYFSWVHVLKNNEIYLYETVEGDIIPVTQVEHEPTFINEHIDLTYIGKINKFIKMIDEKTFYDTMLINVSLPKKPTEAWIYLITCLINKTSRKLFYPTFQESKILIFSKMLDEFMSL